MGVSAEARIEEVSPTVVWERLQSDAKAVLVDVRTRAEWNYVGVADLSAIGKKPVLIEWQTFPDSAVDQAFTEKLTALLTSETVGKDAEIFFICRSGVRSKAAAQAMTKAGFSRCRTVTDGFEGPLDPSRHRGRLAGWKAAGLPWAQG